MGLIHPRKLNSERQRQQQHQTSIATEQTEKQQDTTTMTETEATTATVAGKKRKDKGKESTPPNGYVCSLCQIPGHWIQQCTQGKQQHEQERKKRKRLRKNPFHVHAEGVDPSQDDINTARTMQSIKPPNCLCNIKSRLKKVKRSKVKEESRANGAYFFFCSKAATDDTKCNFVIPVEESAPAIGKDKSEKMSNNFFAKKRGVNPSSYGSSKPKA